VSLIVELINYTGLNWF